MKRFATVVMMMLTSGVMADAWYRAQVAAAKAAQRGQTGAVAAVTAPAPAAAPAYGGGYQWQPVGNEQIDARPTGPALQLTSGGDAGLAGPGPAMRTTTTWRVMGSGLLRGLANTTMWPGELGRGVAYEYTAKEWYVASGSSLLAGFGGGINRLCAGLADVVTCGYFGDTQLAKGYPEYVWQGDWVYQPEASRKIRDTSGTPHAPARQDVTVPPRPTTTRSTTPRPTTTRSTTPRSTSTRR
jgi:hypothetical protein